MKKILSIVCFVILSLVLVCGAFGCSGSVKGNVSYNLFAYDMKTASFVKLAASVRFNSDLSGYEYVFSDGSLTLRGSVVHEVRPDRYTLICSEDAVSVVKEKYKQQLVDGGASSEELNDYQMVSEGLTPKMQLLNYNGYLFSPSSVELFHSASSDRTDRFEGRFVMTANAKMVELKGGTLYSDDGDGNLTVKSGYYTVSNGIMTITFTDKDGKDSYDNGVLNRKKYLMATVAFADDFELIGTDFEDQMNDSEWLKLMKSDLDAYSGKTYAVLTDEFYSANEN